MTWLELSLLSACVFAQAIGDGAVFTDVSVVVEGDQGEISTLESILTTKGARQARCWTTCPHMSHSCSSGSLSER